VAWIETHGDSYRVRYRLPNGKIGTEPGYPSRNAANRRVRELEDGAAPLPGLTPAQRANKIAEAAAPPAPTPPAAPAAPAPDSTREAPGSLFNPFLPPKPENAQRPRARITGNPTLSEWAHAWAATHRVAPTTAVNYDSHLRTHILPALGHLPLNRIDRLEVKAFAHDLSAKLKPTSVHTVIGVLSTLLAEAVDSELIDATPCRRLKLPARRATTKVIATPVQVLQIAARLDPLPAIMVITGAYTGMRWGELAGLSWNSVRLEHDIPHIAIDADTGSLHEVSGRLYLAPPKTHNSVREIALPQFLLEMLRHARKAADGEIVFASASGKHLRRTNFRQRAWDPAAAGVPHHPDPARRAPIAPGMTFHSLRHCHKTWMNEDQIPAPIQDYRLGHAGHGVGEIYNHRNVTMQIGVAAAMQRRYEQSAAAYAKLPAALPGPPAV
jgi:integrase